MLSLLNSSQSCYGTRASFTSSTEAVFTTSSVEVQMICLIYAERETSTQESLETIGIPLCKRQTWAGNALHVHDIAIRANNPLDLQRVASFDYGITGCRPLLGLRPAAGAASPFRSRLRPAIPPYCLFPAFPLLLQIDKTAS